MIEVGSSAQAPPSRGWPVYQFALTRFSDGVVTCQLNVCGAVHQVPRLAQQNNHRIAKATGIGPRAERGH